MKFIFELTYTEKMRFISQINVFICFFVDELLKMHFYYICMNFSFMCFLPIINRLLWKTRVNVIWNG